MINPRKVTASKWADEIGVEKDANESKIVVS